MNPNKYEDFIYEKPNTFWLPVAKSSDTVKMTKYHADYQVAGDTDSTMSKLPKEITDQLETMDDVVEVSDLICEITNDGFADYCKTVFNIPEDRASIINADREVIADKALFVSKKRYIMHVVNLEGKKVDYLKIMGLEIIKSDTSQAVKEMLTELTNMMLDEVDMSIAHARIKEMKEEFKRRPLHEIATPMNCKTLKKAKDQRDATGSLKGIHYSARAALFYNDNCGIQDKPIFLGERIGLVYIKDPKSKYIAFPIEESFLPPWMDDIEVDWETMWKKAYTKIVNYMKAVGWDIQSRKEQKRQELFGF